ncbi:MAG: hypothetical protein WBE89_18915, partial [Methyloceanibacter sp.]
KTSVGRGTGSTGSAVIDAESSKHPVTFAELRAKPDSNDRVFALNALQVVLTEGWRRRFAHVAETVT